MALRYQLRAHGSKLPIEDAQIIENKRNRLQKLINMFEHQADSFLLYQHHTDNPLISVMGNYDEYDHVDDVDDSNDTAEEHHAPSASDGSGMDIPKPEDLPIILPSSLGWEWCTSNGRQSLAAKEAQLRHAQASDSIHQIRLALGFKSALFRTQVRPAKTQKTKTRAWNAIYNVETTIHEHARIYSMARDAYRTIQQAYADGPDLPPLHPQDLHVATLVLGSEQVGQRNTQQSWIWGFGQTVEDDGTWMNDCELSYSLVDFDMLISVTVERVHWLRAKAQFERWLEEQDSIHNEAQWIPAYFHTRAESWRTLMAFAAQGSMKGHEAYASYQMNSWEELSRSAVKALSPIVSSPLKRFKVESILLS